MSEASCAPLLLCIMVCLTGSCGGGAAEPEGTPDGSSGGRSSGGSTSAGGTNSPGGTGGAGSSQTGGGGAVASGGGVGSGGTVATGGTVSSGGMVSTGGAASTTGGSGGEGGQVGCFDGRVSLGGVDGLGSFGADGFAVTSELASDLGETAPATVGIVKWALDESCITEAHIDFGLDTTYGMTAPVDLTRAAFRTVLVGMKPERTYHFRIVAVGASQTAMSEDRTLTTGAGAAVADLPIASLMIPSPDKVDKGFFIGSFWSPLASDSDLWAVFIMDTDGDVVWSFSAPPESPGGELGFARARLSADSQDVWLARASNGGAPLRRVSIDTLDSQTYPEAIASHDIAAVSGDTMAYLDYRQLACNGIIEIDKAGRMKTVLDPASTLGLTSCHGNSVRYSKTEDVYVWSSHREDVYVLGRDGSLRWKLSDKVSGGNAAWGGYQHGTQLLDDSILMFANDNSGLIGGTQALEFDLDGTLIRSIVGSYDVNFFGDVQRLPNGNTLMVTGNRLEVIDENDERVWEIDATVLFGYVEFRQSLYGLPLDIQQ